MSSASLDRVFTTGRWANSSFGVTLKKLFEGNMIQWIQCQGSPPNCLYHYTTSEGLLGILRSNRMWATHVSYLNDPSELRYARALIKSCVKERATQPHSEILSEFFALLLHILTTPSEFYNYYVVCFCEKGDLLSQWRTYSNRGGGYAIGFNANELGEKLTAPIPLLRQIIYDEQTQREWVISTLDRTMAEIELLTTGQTVQEAGRAIVTTMTCLADMLEEYIFSFKDPAFKEEAEWRAIVRHSIAEEFDGQAKLEFRAAGEYPVPYVELDLSPTAGPNTNRLPICSIRMGPTLNPALARKSLEMICTKYGYSSVEVEDSIVPLRA
jgi:hypothetical protein